MTQQHIFVNELSVVEQAENEHGAGVILVTLADVLKALIQLGKDSGCESKIYRMNDLTNRNLLVVRSDVARVNGDGGGDVHEERRSFHRCVASHREVEVRAFLLRVLTNNLRCDELLEGKPQHRCFHSRREAPADVTGTSVAAAAAFGGALVSLRECDEFPAEPVRASYCESEHEAAVDLVLANFVEKADVEARRRIYESNPKHKGSAYDANGVRISAMDLSVADAQAVLNRAVAPPGEKRLFALHERKLYVFFAHQPLRFHGYHVTDPQEYERRDVNIYNYLQREGCLDDLE